MMSTVLGLRPSSFVFAQDVVRSNDSIPERILDREIIADTIISEDSTEFVTDSVLVDSIPVDSVKEKKNNGLVAVVDYQAKDSLIFSMGNMVYLFGESKVTYDDIELNAELMKWSLDSSLVHADGVPDTTKVGKLIGAPKFKDKSGEYEMKHISYNFKTAKGHITDVVTQQGDGYVTGGTTKKMPDNDIFLENGRYTTCDQTECPHFYIQLTKARVRPNKNIVTGPAYLVVADVPLPLAIPFGYFPFTKSYSSGILMPTYGADQQMGLYLRNGGYYFAINDYIDLTLTGDFYTKGTWGVNMSSKYARRYKFSGNFSFSYMRTVTGEKGMPDYSVGTNMKASWTHTQDSRYNPNMTLSANVDFSTSGYERSNVATYYSQDMTQSTKQSRINATFKIPNTSWQISTAASITQRQKDSTLVVQLPDLSISSGRLYPFKRKVRVGSERWYEKISLTYKGQLSNSITSKESQLFDKNIIKDWKNGMKHEVDIPMTFTLFNYINITPSVRFTDRMYSNKTLQYYDPSIQNSNGSYGGIARDTVFGFYNVFDYSTSISMNTKLYGMYKPLWKSKLVAVRHLFTPTVSFSYTPNFGNPKYGSWSSYTMPDASTPGGWKTVEYSPFQGYLYGTTSKGLTNQISFSFDNNIEAKFRSDKDSTGYKKVSIIDNLHTGISYNFAADSMRWSETIPVNATFKLGKVGTVNLNATFDTYMYEVSKTGAPIKVDKTRWSQGKFPRLMNTSYSFGYQLSNQKLKQWFAGGEAPDYEQEGYEDEDEDLINNDLDPSVEKEKENKRRKKNKESSSSTYDADGYFIWSMPWTMNISYSMRYGYSDFNIEKKEYNRKITHSATINGTLQPTKTWNFNYSLSYDFNLAKVTYMNFGCSRDMHCWTLTANLNPIGRYASFNVCVAVKSSMLSDLKYEKSSASSSNKIRWYDD